MLRDGILELEAIPTGLLVIVTMCGVLQPSRVPRRGQDGTLADFYRLRSEGAEDLEGPTAWRGVRRSE